MAKRGVTVETPGAVAPAEPEADAAPASAVEQALPNEWDIDAAAIPFGRTVMSKQGLVCSTADDPARNRPR